MQPIAHMSIALVYCRRRRSSEEVGGWVGRWINRKEEEEQGFRMRCCGLLGGGWVGGWVGYLGNGTSGW